MFSAYGLACNTGQVLGILAAGLLTTRLGLMTMLNAQALIYLATGVFAAWQITKRLRQHQADQPGQAAEAKR